MYFCWRNHARLQYFIFLGNLDNGFGAFKPIYDNWWDKN
jgi:hypothetical protein